MLRAEYTSQFNRDSKKLKNKHINLKPLKQLIDLVLLDTPEARNELYQRHNMHELKGNWAGSRECHIANAGDWLVVWREGNGLAVFQRTGSHDEIFK